MTTYSEQVLDDTVEGKKLLGLTVGFEATHVPLPLPGWLMRSFGAIVGIGRVGRWRGSPLESSLACIRGFPLRARLGLSVTPSPTSATSHAACGFSEKK